MDIDNDSHRLTRLTVIDTGRRRRWLDEERIRIVEESLSDSSRYSVAPRLSIIKALCAQIRYRWA
jgi:transposase